MYAEGKLPNMVKEKNMIEGYLMEGVSSQSSGGKERKMSRMGMTPKGRLEKCLSLTILRTSTLQEWSELH